MNGLWRFEKSNRFFVSSVEIYLIRVYVAMRVNLERVLREELDNPVYIGKIAYGKSANEKVKGTRKR